MKNWELEGEWEKANGGERGRKRENIQHKNKERLGFREQSKRPFWVWSFFEYLGGGFVFPEKINRKKT